MDVSQEVLDRAKQVSLVLMDVDGVLTDGRIIMFSDGSEGRAFSARDGHGIRLGQRGGLLFGIVSGRESRVVSDRAEELYITEVHQGIFEKLERYREIVERFQLPHEAVCYIGDDMVDVPVLRQVGFAVAPASAEEGARQVAHWVTPSRGGEGAVRDLVNLILLAKGKWESVTERYFKKE